MPVKPFLMSDLRKSAPPLSPAIQHRSSIGNGMYNRFNLLDPIRGRTLSAGKRLLSDDDAPPASPKVPRFDSNQVFEKLASQDKLLEEAKNSLKVAKEAVARLYKPDDGALGTILFSLGAAVENIVLHSEATKSNLIDLCKVADVPAAQQGRGGRQPYPAPAKGPFGQQAKAKPPPSTEDSAAAKVKRVLREAERRTVLFELDLGAAPIINKESISKKVTMALHGAAASGEHDWNIRDAGEMVDDVLSCAQLEFLGSGTRKFFNNKDKTDKRSGKMCTVPVRMDFKNKDNRIRAEATLRSICKVSCSTPYPKRLRAIIGKAILEGKKHFPKSYIRTKVDVDNLVVTASARNGQEWTYCAGPYPIPLDVLDPNTVIPPPEKEVEMDTTTTTTATTTPVVSISVASTTVS